MVEDIHPRGTRIFTLNLSVRIFIFFSPTIDDSNGSWFMKQNIVLKQPLASRPLL